MNAPLLTRPAGELGRRRVADAPSLQAPSLHALAAWRVMPGAFMLLAQGASALPGAGVVHVPGARGAFRALRWTGPEGAEVLLLAVRLPGSVEVTPGAVLSLRAEPAVASALALPGSMRGDAEFGQELARLAGAGGAAVARFLLETLQPSGTHDVPHVGVMLRAFLSQAAQPDGVVEIMTAVPDGCVLLQGWGAPIAGAVQVLLAGPTLRRYPGHAGGFARADVAAPAGGVMLALPPSAAAGLAGVDHVFVLGADGLHSRALVEHRLLDPAASLGHIRHMLPALQGPAPMLALLRETLRPRFESRDTLMGHARPVRAAVDCVVAAPGVGAYVSGWLFDPARGVAAVHLCAPGGFSARLDGTWTRVPRPDVTEAYRAETGFPAPADADSGFAVFVPTAPVAMAGLHLQVSFSDADRAFMPLEAADPADARVRARLLASVDLYKPSGVAIVETHLAPLMARVRAAAPGALSGRPRVMLAGPSGRAHAVVVPLAVATLPRALLSGLLHDALDGSELLVLVCGPEWDVAGLAALRELLAFHAVAACILQVDETPDGLIALRAAAGVTAGEALLVVDPGVSGLVQGWRHALRAALAPGAAFACPTLLYEDWSIRYAGAGVLRVSETAPYARVEGALAGLPGGLAASAAAGPAGIGTMACCLVRRQALTALDGVGALSTVAGREAAFFLRLLAAGLPGVWVPAVRAYAPEGPDGLPHPVGRLVDGWVLRATAAGG